MLVLEHAPAYGISICEARRFTEEEKKQFSEWFRDVGLSAIPNTHEYLPHVTWRDLPKRHSDGCFCGCSNIVWILTEDEADHYRFLESERAKAAHKKEEAEARKQAERAAQDESEKTAIRAKITQWDVCDIGPHEVKHTFSVNGETLQFLERDIFDFGVVINPNYAVAPGLDKGGICSVNEAGVRVWQTYQDSEGWRDVRPLTESEVICVQAIIRMGRFAHSLIRM